MRKYNPKKPLIAIHIPKTGGSSVQKVYKEWFRENLYFHYNSPVSGLPKKLDLKKIYYENSSIAIYGHFNASRGFGIQKYYPEVEQFVTILRDPFEMHLSRYFYLKKTTDNFKKSPNIKDGCDIETFFNGFPSIMLEHFPRKVTLENYKDIIEDYFIEIGIMEMLDISLSRIAKKLGLSYNNSVPFINKTERDSSMISDNIKVNFIKSHKLEYQVYNYILLKYEDSK